MYKTKGNYRAQSIQRKQVQVQLITKPREGNTGYTKTHEYS